MPLDSSQYLKSHGWAGEGSGLHKGSRAKPLLVPVKKSLSGVGKDRDTAYNFWDTLYDSLAKKMGGGVEGDMHRTKTGILSPLPPPSRPRSALNTAALADAKQQAARTELYARFLRGQVIPGDKPKHRKRKRDAFLAEYVRALKKKHG